MWHGVIWVLYGPWTLDFCHVVYSIAHGKKVTEGAPDGDQSGSDGREEVPEAVRRVIREDPPILHFGTIDEELVTPPPPYIRDNQPAPM